MYLKSFSKDIDDQLSSANKAYCHFSDRNRNHCIGFE